MHFGLCAWLERRRSERGRRFVRLDKAEFSDLSWQIAFASGCHLSAERRRCRSIKSKQILFLFFIHCTWQHKESQSEIKPGRARFVIRKVSRGLFLGAVNNQNLELWLISVESTKAGFFKARSMTHHLFLGWLLSPLSQIPGSPSCRRDKHAYLWKQFVLSFIQNLFSSTSEESCVFDRARICVVLHTAYSLRSLSLPPPLSRSRFSPWSCPAAALQRVRL